MSRAKAPKFVSNEAGPSDLFENKLLNRLTRTHTAIPVTLFFLYAAGLLYYSKVATELSNWTIVGLFFAGIFVFTFVEYAMHRWLYHPPEDATDKYQEFTYTIHGHHHAYPKDKQRLAMPPLLAVTIGTVLLIIFKLILNQYACAFLAGFMVGYAMYLLVHYMVHMFKMPNNFLKALWINHAIHHYADHDDVLYGVSTPLWDYIFGTLPEKKSMKGVEVNKS